MYPLVQKSNNDETFTLLPKQGIDNSPVYSVVEPNIDAGENSQYNITFLEDLADGLYSIYGEDDAGNQSLIDEEQIFIIDKTKPILPKLDLGIDDTGKFDNDLLTNVTPTIFFLAEEGLSAFIENISTSTLLQPEDFPELDGPIYTQTSAAGGGYYINFNNGSLFRMVTIV